MFILSCFNTTGRILILHLLSKTIFMRYLLIMVAFLFAACQKKQESTATMPLAGELYAGVQSQLDLSKIETVTERGVTIYVAKFRENPDRFYFTSQNGDFLYTRNIIDEKNATVEISNGHETVTVNLADGKKNIATRTADWDHGGTGFCQRETGESFSACFKAESDEFCDSFISCIAMATQPTVAMVIAAACSCKCNCKS